MSYKVPGTMSWLRVLELIAADREVVVAAVLRRIEEELPSYKALPSDVLDRHVRVSLEQTVDSARAGRAAINEREVAELAEVGEVQARHGVPVEDMLRVWRMGIEIVLDRARALAGESGLSEADVLEFVGITLAWSDVGMVTSARGHRNAEIDIARTDHERRAGFVRGVLLGSLAPARLRLEADAYGIDTARQYIPVRARPTPGTQRHELERALGFHETGAQRTNLTTAIDEDVCGFVRQRPTGKIPGICSIGPAAPIERLSEPFRLATRALTTAAGLGLTGVVDLEELGMRPAIVADRDVTEMLTRRYLEPLQTTVAGNDIIATLRAYLECRMHVERTAEKLVVHPNTVRYRIGRFEELTGASLRDVSVAGEVWWALQARPPA